MFINFDAGDCYVNKSGDVVEILRSGACSVKFHVPARRDLPAETLTFSEAMGLVMSGAWKWHGKRTPTALEPRCTKCGDKNEYQSSAFTCWKCRNGA